ncbi:unnamed protein product [Echinostoma caproni]|uniref:Lipoprotein n=1 Tax=Echinostoma caproni TaxID=27848 RepID=A0A183A0L5_9TREM|nr:unnamed protein product [Echinostoma caproni]
MSGCATLTLPHTGHKRNEEGPEPTPVGRIIMTISARKDRPEDVPTQLETDKELWATVAPGSSVTIIPSAAPQQPRTKSMLVTKNEESTWEGCPSVLKTLVAPVLGGSVG